MAETLKKIDATGKVCPLPVIMTKNALKDITEGFLEVTVDNFTASQNIEKLCKEIKVISTLEKKDDLYIIQIEKKILLNEIEEKKEDRNNVVVVIDSTEMGKGKEELGKILMKGFIYTLTELETLPTSVILYNSGVLLGVQGSDSEEDLKKLEELGVSILLCGACTNFYNVTEKIKIGTITNMYNILNIQIKGDKIIKP
ncbi:MAG: sulfurtransferase-like selenium metabolism protein YedF [Fusobacteriaceae bacterium]